MTQPTVALTHAQPGDLVEIGNGRGRARVLSTAPDGTIYLQPEGYRGPQYIITINPSLPDTLPFTHPHTVHS